ncbi:uncharacterized protein VP01_5226g1, partial [Puccinia sorghi]
MAQSLCMKISHGAAPNLTRATSDSAEPAIPTPIRHEFCPALKAYLRANIRLILLQEDLECYGRRMGQKLHSSKSPFALIKVNDCHPQHKINTQGSEFHSQHLPPNYANNPKITSQLDSLIASIRPNRYLTLPSLSPQCTQLWTLTSRTDQNRSLPLISIQPAPNPPCQESWQQDSHCVG